MKKEITFVLTSCNRFDLLVDTIESFLECNVYPIKRYILTEDSGDVGMYRKIKKRFGKLFDNIIFDADNPRMQTKIIDRAYSSITTEYIFHCEDDWYFHKKGNFIEQAIEVLEYNPRIIEVWLRDLKDLPSHKPCPHEVQTRKGVKYHHVFNYGESWAGFSLNPNIRRLSDYIIAGNYSRFIVPSEGNKNSWVMTEKEIAEFYSKLGYIGAWLGNYCYHTGYGKRA